MTSISDRDEVTALLVVDDEEVSVMSDTSNLQFDLVIADHCCLGRVGS